MSLAALMMLLIGLVFSGCAGTSKERIYEKSADRGHVFEELKVGEIQPGYAILTIKAAMKTPEEGYYLLERKDALHGKPGYPFIFNIGGQGVIWMAQGMPDTQQRFTDGKRNPEGGKGVKYNLEKKIIVKAGRYKVYLGLSEENFQQEVDIALTEGKASTLQFVPVYRTGRNRSAGSSFYEGIRKFEVLFEDQKIAML